MPSPEIRALLDTKETPRRKPLSKETRQAMSHVALILVHSPPAINERAPMEMAAKINDNFTVIDEKSDELAGYNMIAAPLGTTRRFERLPFESVTSIGLVDESAKWAFRFNTTHADWADEARLDQRGVSIEHFKSMARGEWQLVRNHHNDPEATAHNLLAEVQNEKEDVALQKLAVASLIAACTLGPLTKEEASTMSGIYRKYL